MEHNFQLIYESSYSWNVYLHYAVSIVLIGIAIKEKTYVLGVIGVIFLIPAILITHSFWNLDSQHILTKEGEVSNFVALNKHKSQYFENFIVGHSEFYHSLTIGVCMPANAINIKNGDYLKIQYFHKGRENCIIKVEQKEQ